ncbi:bifunctional non-homologous end joining protein LigD [Cohnella sp. OV330]|uniref:ATP-dependent DNA ligase n=1 Tax=Cohnella sp. OV330 TaxID=1855288 RepID=UPI0008E0BC64|nr:DNA ligase [Cohnella sp. OV330]SFB50647.1 bifunctional non-homologous end joining protein LigD [Cohnella sp. OV330]
MEPIYPFEPVISETIPTESHWRYEIKWDGTRIVTYHDQGATTLFNRKLNERTSHYPELLDVASYCSASSVILDGEVIALAQDGKPSFHEVMRRDLIQKLDRVEEMQRLVPITYMVFDIVYYNGEWVNRRPLADRLELLHSIVTPNERVQLVLGHEGEQLFEVIRQQDMEGIVCKDLRSAYAIGGKDARWRKVKNYGDIVAVIGGFTLNDGIVNAVLLGQYDQTGKLWYIGHTGTGRLTKAEWRDLTATLAPLAAKRSPFANRPDRHKDAYWVTPKLTAKVQYSEWRWREGRALRQPSIQAFVNASPEQCKLPWIE